MGRHSGSRIRFKSSKRHRKTFNRRSESEQSRYGFYHSICFEKTQYFKACSICHQIRSQIINGSGVPLKNYKITFNDKEILEVKGDIIQALYEESAYLKEKYPDEDKESIPYELQVNEMSSETFRLMINHIFSKKVFGITWENVYNLFLGAKFLGIPRFQKVYHDWIVDEISGIEAKVTT